MNRIDSFRNEELIFRVFLSNVATESSLKHSMRVYGLNQRLCRLSIVRINIINLSDRLSPPFFSSHESKA